MKNITLFLSIVFLLNMSYGQTPQVIDTILPFNDVHWANMNCSAIHYSNDSIAAYGSDYRIGVNLFYKDFFNFQNEGEAYFEISYDNGGGWQAEQVRINGSKAPAMQSNYTSNTHYFIRIKFNQNHSEDYVIASGNYDDAGGNVVETHTYNLSDKAWNILSSSNFHVILWDNYGGTNSSITVWHVMLKNVIPVDNSPNVVSQETFDFENGNIPASLVPLETDWSIDMTQGYNSNASLHAEAPVGEERSVYMDVPENTLSIEFDVKYQSETHKPAVFSIDTLAGTHFDHSSIGCWKHYKWQFNDHQPHRVYWKIAGTAYDQLPGKLWIDNIHLTYDDYSGINSENYSQNPIVYPNPARKKIYFGQNIKTYEIYDLTGKLMQKGQNDQSGIYLKMLQKGIYLIKTHDHKQKIYVSKLIVN